MGLRRYLILVAETIIAEPRTGEEFTGSSSERIAKKSVIQYLVVPRSF